MLMRLRRNFGAIAFILTPTLAFGQGVGFPSLGAPTLGNTNTNRLHMGFNGKPCLTLQGQSKAQIIDKNIYEHWIKASNACGQGIKVKVCYHKTDDCITMDVPAFGQRAAILGIFPALGHFQYDAREQF